VSDVITVKKAIINLLREDRTIRNLLGEDQRGNCPVYHSFVQHVIHKPCITVEDVTDQGEVSGLNDGYEIPGGYEAPRRSEWHHAVIQIDCWSSRNADERDQIQLAVERCLLKGVNQGFLRSKGVVSVQEPLILALDEVDVKPPVWRKSLRYRVFYVLYVLEAAL